MHFPLKREAVFPDLLFRYAYASPKQIRSVPFSFVLHQDRIRILLGLSVSLYTHKDTERYRLPGNILCLVE